MKVNIVSKGMDKLLNQINSLNNLNNNKEFLKFIENKSMEVLKKQTDLRLKSIQNEDDADLSIYRGNHKSETISNGFKLSNETMANLDNLSEETRNKYSGGFSISKAVEYGIGYVGKNSIISGVVPNSWEHDINNHGSKGWYYKDGENYVWTRGYSGAAIFYFTSLEIKRLMPIWIDQFIESTKGE